MPVIARLQGHTLGGGLELAMAADLRIAADDAVVGMPEVKVGIPSVIHAAMMPAQIGGTRASWLLLTGENIGALQAERWGLLNECVPGDQLDARIAQIAEGLGGIGIEALRQQSACCAAGRAWAWTRPSPTAWPSSARPSTRASRSTT